MTDTPTKSLNAESSSIFTIGDAIQQYAKNGEQSIHKGYRDVIKMLVDSGYDKPIKNDSYEDALFLSDIMFENSQKSVKIFTGGGIEEFIEVLNDQFKKMLHRIKLNNGSVKVVTLGGVIPNALKQLVVEYKETLQVVAAKAKEGTEVRHFIVCDEKMIRSEEPHGPLTKDSPASDIKAEVYFDNPSKGKFFSDMFDAIWKKVGSGN